MRIHLVDGIDFKGIRCIQATVMSKSGELSFPFGWGFYVRHENGQKDIIVAKQKSVFGTLEILIHELGHWILDSIPILTHKQWDTILKIFPSNIFGKIKRRIA